MAKYTTKGTTIKVEIATVSTAIPQCETIGLPHKISAEIEASDHDSVTKEYLGDLPEMATFDVVLRWDPADTVHEFLDENVGEVLDWEIGIKGTAAPTTNDIYTFSGVLLAFQKAPHPHQGGVMMATATIRPNAVTKSNSGA